MRMIAGAIVFHAGVIVLRTDSAPATLMIGWAIVAAGGVMMLVPERRESPVETSN